MPAPDSLSLAQARRIALAAQGFADPRPTGAVDRRHFRRVLGRVGVVQLDSVNVVTRAHELAFFARLGPYDRAALHRYLWSSGEVFECWAHMASVTSVDMHPLMRWRMASTHEWAGLRRIMDEHRDLLERLRAEVHARGPISAGELAPDDRKAAPWWGWGPSKLALEALFWLGEVAAIRRPSFERLYAAPASVLPEDILASPDVERETAWRELLRRATRAHGVGTARDLVDYYRMPFKQAAPLLPAMASDGELRRVSVEGWREPAYVHPDVVVPRKMRARALLAPFDSVVWERARAERLFGFRYRIEIYTPAPKRVHGYYVLPFLLDDELAARVDIKADRQARVLRLRAAHLEDSHDPETVAMAVAAEARTMAGWLGLDGVEVDDRGTLAPALRATMAR
jgi:uncharacterized protein YcaQ